MNSRRGFPSMLNEMPPHDGAVVFCMTKRSLAQSLNPWHMTTWRFAVSNDNSSLLPCFVLRDITVDSQAVKVFFVFAYTWHCKTRKVLCNLYIIETCRKFRLLRDLHILLFKFFSLWSLYLGPHFGCSLQHVLLNSNTRSRKTIITCATSSRNIELLAKHYSHHFFRLYSC